MIEKLKREMIFPNTMGDGYLDEENHYWKTKSQYLQTEILGMCGCGDPNDTMLYIKEYLTKLDNHEWLAYEDRAYMFFCYWANDKGFADHGSTVRCSWLTDKGKEVLQDINWCIVNEKEEE